MNILRLIYLQARITIAAHFAGKHKTKSAQARVDYWMARLEDATAPKQFTGLSDAQKRDVWVVDVTTQWARAN